MKTILVIDDSALMRKLLRQILEKAGYAVVVAKNGQEGLDAIKASPPDAVTLDINMPVMDGLTCLSYIMTDMPVPVIMVSSLTESGALATFEALEMGAIDYVAKPGGTVSLNISDIEDELLSKIKASLRSRISKAKNLRQRLKSHCVSNDTNSVNIPKNKLVASTHKTKVIDGIVLIGVSTGGPSTLESVISSLPRDFPWPVIVAQHMPYKFTKVFAERLNKVCNIEVQELNRASDLMPGVVYIARGDADVKLIRRGDKVLATSIPPRKEFLWHPSVELLVQSVGEFYEEDSIICVQLTGMGNDGAKAITDLNKNGARTIAESEESAVVFGMPKALIDLGGADLVLDSEDIAQQIVAWVY
ncbi:MAG: two-component system chemotaxis response regulator CheB [Oleiphilaceae bacterium]|jgi:two-component system chemotaxis response regulator CheB